MDEELLFLRGERNTYWPYTLTPKNYFSSDFLKEISCFVIFIVIYEGLNSKKKQFQRTLSAFSSFLHKLVFVSTILKFSCVHK